MVILIAVGQAGDVLRDRIVERELALFGQQEDCGCGELLADRADAVAHLRRGRRVRIELSGAVGLDVGDLSILNDGDGRGGNAGGLQHLIGDVVDAGAQLRRERRLGLRRKQRHGEQEKESAGQCGVRRMREMVSMIDLK